MNIYRATKRHIPFLLSCLDKALDYSRTITAKEVLFYVPFAGKNSDMTFVIADNGEDHLGMCAIEITKKSINIPFLFIQESCKNKLDVYHSLMDYAHEVTAGAEFLKPVIITCDYLLCSQEVCDDISVTASNQVFSRNLRLLNKDYSKLSDRVHRIQTNEFQKAADLLDLGYEGRLQQRQIDLHLTQHGRHTYCYTSEENRMIAVAVCEYSEIFSDAIQIVDLAVHPDINYELTLHDFVSGLAAIFKKKRIGAIEYVGSYPESYQAVEQMQANGFQPVMQLFDITDAYRNINKASETTYF